jgi:hypothetical protein
MAGWRGQTAQSVQDVLDSLLDSCIRAALDQLGKRGEFYPFAYTASVDGGIAPAAYWDGDDRPSPADVTRGLLAGIDGQRDQLAAYGLAEAVSVEDVAPTAIHVSLEHRDGPAIIVIAPYSLRRRRKVALGDFLAQEGQHRIWPAPATPSDT